MDVEVDELAQREPNPRFLASASESGPNACRRRSSTRSPVFHPRFEYRELVRIVAVVDDHVVARPHESVRFESTKSGHGPTIVRSAFGELHGRRSNAAPAGLHADDAVDDIVGELDPPLGLGTVGARQSRTHEAAGSPRSTTTTAAVSAGNVRIISVRPRVESTSVAPTTRLFRNREGLRHGLGTDPLPNTTSDPAVVVVSADDPRRMPRPATIATTATTDDDRPESRHRRIIWDGPTYVSGSTGPPTAPIARR